MASCCVTHSIHYINHSSSEYGTHTNLANRTTPYQRGHVWGRAFTYASPTTWNSLDDNLKDINISLLTFTHRLKTFFFSSY